MWYSEVKVRRVRAIDRKYHNINIYLKITHWFEITYPLLDGLGRPVKEMSANQPFKIPLQHYLLMVMTARASYILLRSYIYHLGCSLSLREGELLKELGALNH